MDILKRSLAPITDAMWNEIDQQAKMALRAALTARKFVDVTGPKGWDYAAVELGRLNIPDGQTDAEVCYGIHLVQPLIELRASFELEIMELDNIIRGAKDIELEPLIQTARKIAKFEEHAIYHGFEDGQILGFLQSVKLDKFTLQLELKPFFQILADSTTALMKASIEGPYALVINPKAWNTIAGETRGYPLKKYVQNLAIDAVILCPAIEGALLVSTRGGDFELILGHDLAVGYEAHDPKYVRLFFTESFTFRVLEPNAIVRIEQ